MLRLTDRRRSLLAEKFADLANFAVAALVFGQAVGQEPFSLWVGVAGIATWAALMLIAFAISGETR